MLSACLLALCAYQVTHYLRVKKQAEILMQQQQVKHANDAFQHMIRQSNLNKQPTNMVDPMTPLGESDTPVDEIEQIKAWHKLSPEQQLKLSNAQD